MCTELLSLLFANDTTLVATSDDSTELFNKANEELCTYFGLNKLSFHPDKTRNLLIIYKKNSLKQ